MVVPRIRAGNYGNNTYGIKTSLPGFDVTNLAEDDDVTKRSFNSQWTSLCKIKTIGAATSEWTQYQDQGSIFVGGGQGSRVYSQSGWRQNTPVPVPTGLPYIPVWEERVLDVANSLFYDDYLFQATTNSSYSGARSYHSGPATSPANTIFMTPYSQVPNVVGPYNENSYYTGTGSFQGYPAYPAYPAKPSYRPTLVYVIYSNRLGDVS